MHPSTSKTFKQPLPNGFLPAQPPSTHKLSQQLNSGLAQLASSKDLAITHQLIKLTQDNHHRTLAFLDTSFRNLLSDLVQSIQTQNALDRCAHQVSEINKQFILNATNPNEQVRNRVDSLLNQQKLEIEKEKQSLVARSRQLSLLNQAQQLPPVHPPPPGFHPPQPKFTPQERNTPAVSRPAQPRPVNTSITVKGPIPGTVMDSSQLNPILLNVITTPDLANPPVYSPPPPAPILFGPSAGSGITNLFPKLTSHKRSRSMLEYDDSLMDEMILPGPDLMPINSNGNQPDQADNITVLENGTSNSTTQSSPSSSRLPEDKTKAFPKSSYRQSAILRNLVSLSLAKLLAQVTHNPRQNWPGSDTEARLAAMGLSVELTKASKLTPEIVFKGPKNLQLQQCKRILLELELGIMRLRQVQAVPRPFRRRRKEEEEENKSQTANQDLVNKYIHSGRIVPGGNSGEGRGQVGGVSGQEKEDAESSGEDHGDGSE